MFSCKPLGQKECDTPCGCFLIAYNALQYVTLHCTLDYSRWDFKLISYGLWIALRYVHNIHREYNLLQLCVCVRVRGHVNEWSQMKPQRDGRSRVWASRGKGEVTVWGRPKPVRHDRSWQLCPVCPQFIAKANPIAASKLAFVSTTTDKMKMRIRWGEVRRGEERQRRASTLSKQVASINRIESSDDNPHGLRPGRYES